MIDFSITDKYLMAHSFTRTQLFDGVYEYELNGFRLIEHEGLYYHNDEPIKNRYRLVKAFRESTGVRLRTFRLTFKDL